MNNKNFIIIGCGISGATIARLLAEQNHTVTIYEKNNFIGGNCYDFINNDKVLIHKYGPHIFHTNDKKTHDFVTRFCKLNGYINKVLVSVNGKKVPLPINFNSIELLFPNKAKEIIKQLTKTFGNQKYITIEQLNSIKDPNIAEFADYVFKNIYSNYTAKMWNINVNDIDKSIINRVKIILDYKHNYFPDEQYQGLPSNGYTDMIKNMVDHKNIKIILNTDIRKIIKFDDSEILINNKMVNDQIIYCGLVDELFNYKFGHLPYRSLDFKFETHKVDKYQEAPIINYPADLEMTRIVEYKQMTLQEINNITTISKEFPGQYKLNDKRFHTPYYPILDKNNSALYNKYKEVCSKYANFHLLGRLSQYKYLDMDDAIIESFKLYEKIK